MAGDWQNQRATCADCGKRVTFHLEGMWTASCETLRHKIGQGAEAMLAEVNRKLKR